MKKFKLIGINEWSKDKLNNSLDKRVYNILTSDKPRDLKLEEYKNLLSEFSPSGSPLTEIKGAGEDVDSKDSEQAHFYDYEKELSGKEGNFSEKKEQEIGKLDIYQSDVFPRTGKGETLQSEEKDTKEKSMHDSELNTYSTTSLSNPPGIQITNWRQLWIDI